MNGSGSLRMKMHFIDQNLWTCREQNRYHFSFDVKPLDSNELNSSIDFNPPKRRLHSKRAVHWICCFFFSNSRIHSPVSYRAWTKNAHHYETMSELEREERVWIKSKVYLIRLYFGCWLKKFCIFFEKFMSRSFLLCLVYVLFH